MPHEAFRIRRGRPAGDGARGAGSARAAAGGARPRAGGGRNRARLHPPGSDALASWAKDDEFPFLFASDSGGVLGKTYGAHNPKFGLDNRNLFVVGPDGKIAYKMAPFREIDPQSYKDLAGAIDRITPKAAEGE